MILNSMVNWCLAPLVSRCEHRCQAAGISITVNDVPGSSALDHLYLMDVVIGVGAVALRLASP